VFARPVAPIKSHSHITKFRNTGANERGVAGGSPIGLPADMVMIKSPIAMPQPAATTVVLSGASGVLGSALRESLRGRHTPVLQLVRRPAGDTQLTWDPAAASPFADTKALEGVQAAVHFSGASIAGHRWTAQYKRELAASRVDSTRVLATALAALQQPPDVLLVASAIGFYGNRVEEILDESFSAGSGFLPELCQSWEAAAQPAVESGIRVVNLRFGVLLNKGPGALEKMLPIFRKGLGGTLGNGRQWMSWISIHDAIAAILFAMDTPSLSGPVNVTAPNPVTNTEFTRALAHQLRRPAILPAPQFALRLLFGQMADEAVLSSTRVIPAKLLKAGFQFSHPQLKQALAAILD
jgi:uncharacterized protein (TIGR01777 family)